MHVISQHYSYSCNDYIFYQNKILVMVAQKQLKIGTFLQRNSSDIRTDTLEKLTLAVRGTVVSRHNEGPITGPP